MALECIYAADVASSNRTSNTANLSFLERVHHRSYHLDKAVLANTRQLLRDFLLKRKHKR